MGQPNITFVLRILILLIVLMKCTHEIYFQINKNNYHFINFEAEIFFSKNTVKITTNPSATQSSLSRDLA